VCVCVCVCRFAVKAINRLPGHVALQQTDVGGRALVKSGGLNACEICVSLCALLVDTHFYSRIGSHLRAAVRNTRRSSVARICTSTQWDFVTCCLDDVINVILSKRPAFFF
jgi:hypothetical protein